MPSGGGNRTQFSLRRTGKVYPVYPWTPVQDEYLRREWLAGTSPKLIGARLQRTEKSIRARAQRRGLKPQPDRRRQFYERRQLSQCG